MALSEQAEFTRCDVNEHCERKTTLYYGKLLHIKGVLGFDREPISSNARQGCLSPCKNSGEKVNANDELALAA